MGDLIAVAGNPLDDISRLQQVALVIKGGLVFKMQQEASVEATSLRAAHHSRRSF